MLDSTEIRPMGVLPPPVNVVHRPAATERILMSTIAGRRAVSRSINNFSTIMPPTPPEVLMGEQRLHCRVVWSAGSGDLDDATLFSRPIGGKGDDVPRQGIFDSRMAA